MPRQSKREAGKTRGDSTGAAPMIADVEEVPEKLREICLELVALTDEFCNERLNEEYQALCRKVALVLCHGGMPVDRGKRAGWASGIVDAVGWVNFLGDPSQDPHVRSEEMAAWFGVSTSTMQSRSREIRAALDLMPLDPRLTRPSRMDDNPLAWMIEIGGLVADIRDAPREFQEAAPKAGLIPYVPGDRGDAEEEAYDVKHVRIPAASKRAVPERAKKSPEGAGAATAGYQLKIKLDHSAPPIWRRLRVPDCTLDVLHEWIQAAMGWTNSHMHEFSVGQERFVMEGMDEFAEIDEADSYESDVSLGELVSEGHKKLRYTYDFGDGWEHTIKVEKTLELAGEEGRPTCLAGEGACPPEDIGGVWGYAEFLDAMNDPQHERYEELKEWRPDPFDPAHFDPAAVNKLLQR